MTEAEPFVRDDVRAFLTMLENMNRPDIRDMSLAELRGGIVAMQQFTELPARELAVIRDLACPGPAGDIPLRLYDARAERDPAPLVLFMHGGGFVMGNLEDHHRYCTEIAAELDLPLLAVDYRLAPEHPFPAAPEDCEAVARWVAANPALLGRDITGLIPMGNSAGGNLAIVVTQSLMLEPANVPVIMQVPIYPVCDNIRSHPSYEEFSEGFMLTGDVIDFFDESYRLDPNDRRAYPVLGPLEGTPPTVLATAGLDPLRDSGRTYAAKLVTAGTDVTYLEMRGTIHGFANIRKAIPSAQNDVLAILRAAKTMLERLA